MGEQRMRSNIEEILKRNPYPGRGIIVGCSEDGKRSVIVYFMMGRSENSRNLIIEKTDDGILTKAYDPSKMTDPSLIIYHPVRVSGALAIVTNGDQTETILSHLYRNSDIHSALLTREFEPDAPHYTPRISGLVASNGGYTLSILKTMAGDPRSCQRCFYEYSNAIPGLGHFISCYDTDGDPLPSFTGEPIPINLSEFSGLEAFANEIWGALNETNKVSLYARERDISTGEVNDLIINKNIPG